MRFLLGFAVLLILAPSAEAGMYYLVTANTSSISGTEGSVDFNFGPGAFATQDASAEILDFSTDGTLVTPPQTMGDVTGSLPGALTFDNQTINNDYFEDFTYGTTIRFLVYLYGPAVAAPDGTSTSGSTFAFSMFSDQAGTIPVLTTDTTFGIAAYVNVNLDGSTTPGSNSVETTNALTAEPGNLITLPSGAVCWGLFHVRRRRLKPVGLVA